MKILVIVCAVLCLSPARLLAWNAMGHMVVAQIAYNHLTPAAKARCDALVAVAVEDSKAINGTFVTAAVWADDLKSDNIRTYDTWHYRDVPFSLDGTPTSGFVQPTWDAVQQINRCIATLQNPASTQVDQATSLRWLLHLVGDLQQPLHCSTAISSAYPQGDNGGNSVRLTGQYDNLHSLWDGGGGYLVNPSRPLNATSQANLDNMVTDIETGSPYNPDPGVIPDPMTWATEGSGLAQSAVYPGISAGTTPSATYLANAKANTKLYLAKGGHRLADLLNTLFGNPIVTSSADSGAGSLRQIILNAPAGSTINFSWRLSNQTITLGGQPLPVTKNLTIDASGIGGIRIDGNHQGRVFQVAAGATVVLDSLTIANGTASQDNGGGILNAGTLTVNRCTLTGNSSSGLGGGIYNDNGTLVVNQSTFTANQTTGGGGIASIGDAVKLSVTNSTLANNTATFAAAILARKGTAQLTQCTVSQNHGTGGTGGIVVEQGCAASLSYSIVADNHNDVNADPDIGGAGGSVTASGRNIIGVAWSDYTATPLAPGWPNPDNGQYIGTATSPGNPLLNPLGNNGGLTPTMTPQSGSPAINNATGSTVTIDERGYPRNVGAPDIGAVEVTP